MEVVANKYSKTIELNYRDIDKAVSFVFSLDDAKKLLSDLDGAIKELERQDTKPVPKKHSEEVSRDELLMCRSRFMYGRDMRNNLSGRDPDIWTLPKGFEVEDDVLYMVWYTWSDSADPADTTMYYKVHYISEV